MAAGTIGHTDVGHRTMTNDTLTAQEGWSDEESGHSGSHGNRIAGTEHSTTVTRRRHGGSSGQTNQTLTTGQTVWSSTDETVTRDANEVTGGNATTHEETTSAATTSVRHRVGEEFVTSSADESGTVVIDAGRAGRISTAAPPPCGGAR